jgi:APA family basic amino acid/polyamine antiporter
MSSTSIDALPRRLNLLDAISIVVGIVIGGGIFVVPNLVARSLPSARMILIAWISAGVISFFGALACAELGAAIPSTGGQYVFLHESYGPFMGFLCGWTMFVVARTAQVAWLAVTLSLYASYFVPLTPPVAKLLALASLALFTTINYRGVEAGALVQRSFTLAKVAGLLAIIGAAFLAKPHPLVAEPVQAHFGVGAFGIAMIACLLAYDGWVQVSFVAGEIQRPQKNMLLALACGVSICIGIYLLTNLAYSRVLTIPQIAASEHVGASAAEQAMGPAGGKLVSFIILLSVIGTLNGCFLTSPRIYFAQARDGLFFRKFGETHPRFQTPSFSIAAQGVWAAVLILTGSYESLAEYAMFAICLFYGLMVAGVFVLRRKQPDLPRPYRMWGYPFTPLLFLAATAWFLINTLIRRPVPAIAGLVLIAAGIPVYLLWRRPTISAPPDCGVRRATDEEPL